MIKRLLGIYDLEKDLDITLKLLKGALLHNPDYLASFERWTNHGETLRDLHGDFDSEDLNRQIRISRLALSLSEYIHYDY